MSIDYDSSYSSDVEEGPKGMERHYFVKETTSTKRSHQLPCDEVIVESSTTREIMAILNPKKRGKEI
jgi:hypothetical protein